MAAVSLNPRDVTFNFTDSCNCCLRCFCCEKTYAQDEHVYVNSRGKLEEFKKSKSNNNIEEAFKRAKSHLFENLNKRLLMIEGDLDEFYVRARDVIDSIEGSSSVKIAHIDDINHLMVKYLNDNRGGK